DLLATWDRHAALDSVATTLFFLWFERYLPASMGGAGSPPTILALEAVLDDLLRRRGTWQIPWGEINRIRRPGSRQDPADGYPVVGGHGGAGIQATFLSRFDAEDSQVRFGYRGSSYVAAIELGDPVHARTIVPFGQSSHPDSPHFDDQTVLYSQCRLKPAWFSREQVRAHAERSYRPGE
ncbi:MAG: penicillin acylase family protein, partial [Planctomycetes bacterium]|nr:penicillin acylase family protein [Planctomycetota bacterium]